MAMVCLRNSGEGVRSGNCAEGAPGARETPASGGLDKPALLDWLGP